MKFLPSLRARFLLGSLLWTAGLLYIAHVVSVILVVGYHAFHGMTHVSTILAIALTLVLVGAMLARSGWSWFTQLRRRLSAVREGRERQVNGAYPTEVQPLVDDLNALLIHHDARVRDALAKAGDLAHGLKTPLAVMAQEADRAEAAGHVDLATTMRQQIERMRRQVEYHLAHARAAASGATPGARTAVAASAEALARTLARLYAGRGLSIDIEVPSDHAVRGQRADLDEMLGNLLDNACKWAASRIVVRSSNGDAGVVITVDDDGPGLAPELRQAVLRRGVRADEAAPGSGFGLAIVRDLAALYGGRIALERSSLGGLRARLELPAAAEGLGGFAAS